MVVFTVVFGNIAKIPSDGVPYPIFSYAALVPWTFFANGLGKASLSIVGSSNLIKKIYFPRLCIPIAAILSGIVDFILSFIMLIGMMFYFGIISGTAYATGRRCISYNTCTVSYQNSRNHRYQHQAIKKI